MSGASAKPSPPRASGKTALKTLSDVSISVQPDDYGLPPGMNRGGLAAFRRSWTRMPKASERETVRMDPYGDNPETDCGAKSPKSSR